MSGRWLCEGHVTVLLFGCPTCGEKTFLTCAIIKIAQKYRFLYDKEARSYGAFSDKAMLVKICQVKKTFSTFTVWHG